MESREQHTDTISEIDLIWCEELLSAPQIDVLREFEYHHREAGFLDGEGVAADRVNVQALQLHSIILPECFESTNKFEVLIYIHSFIHSL